MKLPAYAKHLLRERRAGRHPSVVTVVYGEDWHVAGAEFRLAAKPGEAVGLDWACVAGLPVELVNRSDVAMLEANDAEPLRMVADIARDAAQIVIVEDAQRMLAHELAFLRRYFKAGTWPAWWSEEIENIHGQNRRRWLEEAQTWLAQFAA